jgi:hypothetical protein
MTRFHSPLLAAALVVGLAVPASGQVNFGVKAGANFSSLGGDDVPSEFGSRTGLVVGGFVHYPFSDLLAIQPELLYSQKGADFSAQFLGETVDGTLMVDYIEIPVLLRVNVPAGAPELRPTLHVGPTFAFEVSCKVRYSGFGESGTEDCDADSDGEFVEDDRRKFDMGLALGGGLDIAFLTGTLMIEGRYTLGLQSLDTSSDPEDVKNRTWSITFGYRFR